jgi:Raf kinase inhibitor-like YbhB/YbcL family protein
MNREVTLDTLNLLRRHFALLAFAGITLGMLAASALAQEAKPTRGGLQLTSTTFANNSLMPITTIHNMVVNNVNVCSIDGSPGGNQSPALSWSGAPRDTRTFVVVAYDVTAAFTHWGMYNIAGNATELPMNAGVAGSPYGTQIVNDFFIGAEYDGPCPPANVAPFVHHYVFTVYALDIELNLPSSPNFPATAETLYQALIEAGRNEHILASASITGLYSTTPSSQ